MGRKKNKTQSENYQELSEEFYKFKSFVITRMSEYATRFYVDAQVECQDNKIETHNRNSLAVIVVLLTVIFVLILALLFSSISSGSCSGNPEPPVPQNQVTNKQDTVPGYIDGTILSIDEIK